MAHDARSIANKLIRLSAIEQKSLTHLQVQKLVYFCHAWMLAIYDAPMIRQPVEAWQFGPVIRQLYVSLRKYGNQPVQQIPHIREGEYIRREESIIRDVNEKYGEMTGYQLSQLTHQPGSPWEQTILSKREKTVIDDQLIRDYHKEVYARYRTK